MSTIGDEKTSVLLRLDPINCMLTSFCLIVFCVLFYVIRSGLFASISVSTREPTRGEMVVAYKTGRGSYRGAAELFSDACSLVLDREHIGIYYDDPDSVPENDLRYAVGTVLAEGKDEPDPSELETMVSHGYKIAHFPKPNFAVVSGFPFTTTLSIYMAIFNVYPKLKEYISKNGLCAYPALEIYTKNSIEFMLPLSKQEEFFVPEFCEEQVSIATTDVSNHHDHEDEIFLKPANPIPKVARQQPSSSAENLRLLEENTAAKDDDSSSSFEDLGPEDNKNASEEVGGSNVE